MDAVETDAVAAGPRPSDIAVGSSTKRLIARRSRAVRRLGAAVALAVAAAAVALPAGSAQAQATTEVLVSNVALDNIGAVGSALWVQDVAQDFTTGSNPAGYTLTSIELSLTTVGTDIASPTVTLVNGSVDATDRTTLSNPSSLTADTTELYTFTAPSGTTLTSSTQYWVVVEHDGDDVRINSTDYELSGATDEDTALAGWSIGDYTWFRGLEATDGFQWGGTVEPGQSSDATNEPPEAYLLKVTGTAVGGV